MVVCLRGASSLFSPCGTLRFNMCKVLEFVGVDWSDPRKPKA